MNPLITCKVQVEKVTGSTLTKLNKIWDDIGVNEDEKGERFTEFKNVLSNFLSSVVSSEIEMKERAIKEIDESIEEVGQICEDLELKLPTFDKNKMTLIELQKAVSKRLEELKKLRMEQMEIINNLIEKDEGLCEILGESQYYMPKGTFPSKDVIQAFGEHVLELEKTKIEREHILKELKSKIIEYLDIIEKLPTDEFTKELLASDDDDICLSKAYLSQLKAVHSNLEFQKTEIETQCLDLRDKIFYLWSLLNISDDEKNEFLSTVPSSKYSSLNKLEIELKRLNQLKLENISHFVATLMNNLESWWEKCYISKEEQELFKQKHELDGTFNENVLEILEEEISLHRKYYRDNEEIFKLLDNFNNIFQKMYDLQDKAKDPGRLRNNRGGALLKEEKERKRIKIELPKIQEKLENIIKAHNKENLVFDGKNIDDYIEAMWDRANFKKEQVKSKINNKKTIGTKTTASSVNKRTREAACEGDDKRRKLGCTVSGAPIYTSPTKKQHIVKMPSTLPRNCRPLEEKNTWNLKVPSISANDSCIPMNSLQTTISFDKFENDLRNSNDQLNSTAMPFSKDRMKF